MFKYFRIRRIEKAKVRLERQMQKKQERLEEEQKEKEFQQFLEIAKKGEFLLNYCPKLYINKAGKNLDDYDFKNIEVTNSSYKKMYKVVLDTKAFVVGEAKKLEAEVVVEVRHSIAYTSSNYRVVCITGTALIPKKK